MSEPKGILRVGTSGIAVPGNKQSLPIELRHKSRLSYYSSLFNTVEINSTFKKLPMVATLQRWAFEVPEEFQFTLKVLKEITHVKQLDVIPDNIDRFVAVSNSTGIKKACLLIQFPGGISVDWFNKVEYILQRFDEQDQQNKWRKAVEFRNESWYINETYELLDQYQASMVLHDMPKCRHLKTCHNFPFYYFRFHGPTGNYRGDYSREFLSEQAEAIRTRLDNGKDVYAYFNNTMGNAFYNAMQLKAMLE